MSLRALLALVVILAAAVFLVFRIDRPAPPEGTGAEAALVPGFEQASVGSIEWGAGERRARLERGDGGTWRLTRPLAGEADPREVDALLGALARARIARVVASGTLDRSPYGLGDDAPTLEVAGPSAPTVLRLGRRSPIGSERYVAIGDRIVLVDGTTVAAFERPPEAFRERRLVPLEAERIRRITLERPEGRLVVERSGTSWTLAEPVRDAADDTACDTLARAVARLAVDLTDAPISGRTLRLRAEAEAGGPVYEARVALDGGTDGRRTAAREPGGPSGTIEAGILEDIDRPAASLRDKRATPVGYAALRGLTFRASDGSGFTLRRTGEAAPWSAVEADAAALDPAKLDAFLDRATHLRAIDLDACRLPQAADELSFESADGAAGRVRFGRDADGRWCLTSSWRPGVLFTMEDETIRALPRHLGELAAAPAPASAPAAP